MTTITITTQDKKKADAIKLLLQSVEGLSITISEDQPDFMPPDITPPNPKANPHKLVGIWKDSDVSLEAIREKAWRKKSTK